MIIGNSIIVDISQGVSRTPLCFTANTAGSTIAMSVTGVPLGASFQTSTDNETWVNFTPGTTTITLTNVGDKVYFRGSNASGVNLDTLNYYTFTMTGSIAASDNIMSLIDNGICRTSIIPNQYCFYQLFYGCASLTTAPILPATTLKKSCYDSIFRDCTSLTTPPELPATTLVNNCYVNMFCGCTALTSAPILPATNVAYECYWGMFNGCTSLTTPPDLPVTTLAIGCYHMMFYGCTALTTAPALPATTLVPNCYEYMFYNCTSLTTPPVLSATTLATYCYFYMFYGCTSLTVAPSLPATTLATNCYGHMFAGCSSLYVVDSPISGAAEQAWVIPSSGTISATCQQQYMFANCKKTGGSRASTHLAGEAGNSYTYYTQNAPIS